MKIHFFAEDHLVIINSVIGSKKMTNAFVTDAMSAGSGVMKQKDHSINRQQIDVRQQHKLELVISKAVSTMLWSSFRLIKYSSKILFNCAQAQDLED